MKLTKAVGIKPQKEAPDKSQTMGLIKSKNIIIPKVPRNSSGTSRTTKTPPMRRNRRKDEQETKSETPIRLRRKRFSKRSMPGSIDDRHSKRKKKTKKSRRPALLSNRSKSLLRMLQASPKADCFPSTRERTTASVFFEWML